MSRDFLQDIYKNCDTSLMHYGVLGQQWGVRRYQNQDGSLTPEGHKHYGYSETTKTSKHERTKAQRLNDTSLMAMDIVNSALAIPTAALGIVSFNPGLIESAVYKSMAGVRVAQAIDAAAKTKAYQKQRDKESVDENTGFHVKEKELSEKQDLKRVNPSFKTYNSDKHNNCALCSVTADIRKRGYDVTAKSAASGYTPEDWKRWYKGVKIEREDMRPVKNKLFETPKARKEMYQNFENSVTKLKDGSRGYVGVMWKNTRGGHAMMWEIDNGKLKIIDGQSGKIYNDPWKIFKNADSINYARLDNLEPDWNAIKECCL